MLVLSLIAFFLIAAFSELTFFLAIKKHNKNRIFNMFV